MKVAIVLPSISGGGAELVGRQWARALSVNGVRANVILTAKPKTGLVGDAAFNQEFSCSFPSGEAGFLRSISRVRKLLISERIEVVFALMPYANLVCLLAIKMMPRGKRPSLIISEHTVHSTVRNTQRLGHKAQLIMAKRLYSGADAAIAVSHAVATMMTRAQGVMPSRLWVVPNAVLGSAHGTSPANEKLDYDNSGKTIHVAVVGRMVPEKRPGLVFDVAELLQSEGSPVILHFFGEGPLEASLRRKATKSEFKVIFHGWTNRWYTQLPPGSVLAVMSPVEGLGNVLVEAASAGIASVACSRALGVSDATIPGLTSILIAEDDHRAYAKAIRAASALRFEPHELTLWLDRFTLEHTRSILFSLLRNLGHEKAGTFAMTTDPGTRYDD